MSKKSTTTTKSTLTREALTVTLKKIRDARSEEDSKFKAALEKLYADHRATMKKLTAARAAAWAKYSKPAKAAPAKAETKAAEKAA